MLLDLPVEVLVGILAHVGPESLVFGVGASCRQLRNVCNSNSLWLRVLGLPFFHELGLLKSDVEAIPSISEWYRQLLRDESHTLLFLDQFIKTESPEDAVEVVKYRYRGKRALESRFRRPKTLKDHYWARWFADTAIKLEGIHALYTKSPDSFDRPLDACIAVLMVAEKNVRIDVLGVLDDPVWKDAFFLPPLGRVDLMVRRIDPLGLTMIGKVALFIEIAARYNLLSVAIVSFGDPTVSTFACVFFDSGQCFVDFSRETCIVRSTEEIGGRVDYLGATNLRSGLGFADILRDDLRMFSTDLPQQQQQQLQPSQLPQLLSEFLLECFDPQNFRHLFKKLVLSVLGGQVTSSHGPAVLGNYEDLLGRVCTVYGSTCVVLSAHDDRCVMLDGNHITMAPPQLLEPAINLEVGQDEEFRLTVPKIPGMSLQRLGECFERWNGERFI